MKDQSDCFGCLFSPSVKGGTGSVVESEVLFCQCSGGARHGVVADPVALKISTKVVNLTTGQQRGWSKVVRRLWHFVRCSKCGRHRCLLCWKQSGVVRRFWLSRW